jgi:hypothetical protein
LTKSFLRNIIVKKKIIIKIARGAEKLRRIKPDPWNLIWIVPAEGSKFIFQPH